MSTLTTDGVLMPQLWLRLIFSTASFGADLYASTMQVARLKR